MKRTIALIATTAMALGLTTTGALAGGNEWEHVPPHAHVMLLGADLVETEDGLALTFRRCVELTSEAKHAQNNALPTPAHHHSVHTGNAGGSPFDPGALFHAGNWVAPLAPLTPWTGCDSFTSGMLIGLD